MKTTFPRRALATALLALPTLGAACSATPDLEVRTFELEHRSGHEAGELIRPYVYDDREGAPGTVSMVDRAITVRETRDNLEQIARALADFDQPFPDTRLRFQLIEADGFTESDPRIADVEDELRKVFQFRGYRLAGEAIVAVTSGSEVEQRLRTEDGMYLITGEIDQISPTGLRVREAALWSEASGQVLRTTVNIRPGQTLVLGTSPKEGSTATLLLALRAETVPPNEQQQ